MDAKKTLVRRNRLDEAILLLRGEKVVLDQDLAELYGVETRSLNQAVTRARDRFPRDFVFRLTKEEFEWLKSESAKSKKWGGRRYPPYAFTEHGAIMAASVLNSPRAVEMSVFVVRAFVRMLEALFAQVEIAGKLTEIERKLSKHDGDIQSIVSAIRQLMAPSDPPKKRRIGFVREVGKKA